MLTREAIIINYQPLAAEQCLYILEALCEGVVLANMVEIQTGLPSFVSLAAEGVTYQYPQVDHAHGQQVGTLSDVLHKGKATCLEAASIYTAARRLAGHDAVVRLTPQLDAYDKAIPWEYHALVNTDDTQVDPTSDLPGAPNYRAGEVCCP